MIQCQGCTCAGWLWEGEGGLGDHQPGVYVPLKALFLVFTYADYWFSHVVSYFESRDLYYIKIVIRVLDYEFERLIFISSDLNSI